MLSNTPSPVDESAVGEAALPYAEALAQRAAAKLIPVRGAHALRARGGTQGAGADTSTTGSATPG